MVTALFLTSCSSGKYSQSDINMYLTKERVKAKTSPISFRIPKGWHVVDANNSEFVDLWIVRDDMKVSLSLLPFTPSAPAVSLVSAYEVSIEMHRAKYLNNNSFKIVKEKSEMLSGKEVLFYHFKIGPEKFRVALFKFNNKIYELTLYGKNTNIKKEYFIQELVISSAK